MKKLLIVFFLLVLNFTLKAQYPVTQFLGSDSTVIYIKGAARTVGGFINGVYTDTAAANLTRIRQYQAAQIFTTNDSAVWFRMPGATKWVRFMPATPPSPNVDTSYWSLSGNWVADRVATPRLGTTTGHELNIITNDTIRATIPVYGITRVSGGSYRPLVIDTTIGSNGYIGYATTSPGTGWNLTGNAGTDGLDSLKWIGTTDSNAIYFRTNRKLAGYIINSEPRLSDPVRGEGDVGVAYGSHAGENAFQLGIRTTNTLIGTYAGRFTKSSANTFIGYHAGYLHVFGGDFGGRNVAIGDWSMNTGLRAYDNTSVGVFSLNQLWDGVSNTAIGRDVFKSKTHGNGSVGVGAYAGLYSSTGIIGATITNGGSGYTSATVTFALPYFPSNGGQCSVRATGTAVISGGQIVGINITEPGCGYLKFARDSLTEMGFYGVIDNTNVITITGDGTGATATAIYANDYANTYVGGTSGLYRRFSAYETAIGSGSASSGRYRDTANTFLGYQADVNSSISVDSNIHRSTAVGQNAKITKSDQMVLGAVSQKEIIANGNVGIGTYSPTFKLTVSTSNDIDSLISFRTASTSSSSQVRMYLNRANDIGSGYARGMAIFTFGDYGLVGANSGLADYEGRKLSFFTTTNPSITALERMQITPGGNVQIGNNYNGYSTNTDYGYRLFVNGGAFIDSSVVINERGRDADVRIEGDTDPNLFFTDASTDRIGIGTAVPDSTLHLVGGLKIVNGTQGANKVLTSDANGGASWQNVTISRIDTITLASFGYGARLAGDTAAATDSSLYGSFYHDGSDTLIITGLRAVITSGDTLGVQVYYNDTINVIGSAVATSTLAVNSSTTGNSTTTFSNNKIPPGNWVWCKSPTVVAGRKPEYLSVSLIGYRKTRQ